MKARCKCTQYELDLDDCEVLEIADICHSTYLCAGKHSHEIYHKDKRIEELESLIRRSLASDFKSSAFSCEDAYDDFKAALQQPDETA